MRTFSPTSRSKREYRRMMKGALSQAIDRELDDVLLLLANDAPLPAHHRDHALTGNLSGCRDCHIRFDLVLIYRKPNAKVLELLRLGSHSQLDLS